MLWSIGAIGSLTGVRTIDMGEWFLQMDAFCVVSDSGTLSEESSFYLSVGRTIPAVCIRTSTERPEALDKGCSVLSGIDKVGLLQSVDLAVEMVRNGDLGVPVPDCFCQPMYPQMGLRW